MAVGRVPGAVAAAISMAALSYFLRNLLSQKSHLSKPTKKKKQVSSKGGLIDAIGNTPLIRINSLSDATGCEVRKSLAF